MNNTAIKILAQLKQIELSCRNYVKTGAIEPDTALELTENCRSRAVLISLIRKRINTDDDQQVFHEALNDAQRFINFAQSNGVIA